jgi:hypothetical protein
LRRHPAARSEFDAMASTSASASSRYAKHRRIGEDEEAEEEEEFEEEVGTLLQSSCDCLLLGLVLWTNSVWFGSVVAL